MPFFIKYLRNTYRYVYFGLTATWPSGTARRWQILRDGFDSRLEPIAFDICNRWLLTRRAQAHFAISLNYCWIFSSIQFENLVFRCISAAKKENLTVFLTGLTGRSNNLDPTCFHLWDSDVYSIMRLDSDIRLQFLSCFFLKVWRRSRVV